VTCSTDVSNNAYIILDTESYRKNNLHHPNVRSTEFSKMPCAETVALLNNQCCIEMSV